MEEEADDVADNIFVVSKLKAKLVPDHFMTTYIYKITTEQSYIAISLYIKIVLFEFLAYYKNLDY